MNAKLPSLVGLLSVFASPIFVQASSPSTHAANYHWVAITAGFSMAIASAGCVAQAKATAAAAEDMRRNPGASAAIRFAVLLASC